MKSTHRFTFVLLVTAIGLQAACSPVRVATMATEAVLTPAISTTLPTTAADPIEPEPALAEPTLTSAPLLLPTPTPAPVPTAPPFALGNELTIAALLEQEIEGSPITIEQALDSGANYLRYIASYQSEGNKIYGLLTVPFGDPPPDGFKAIVFVHGYIPPNQYRTTERYVAYVDALAQAGFVVFKIDLRGFGESEGEPTGAYFSPGYTIDTIAALKSLQTLDSVDPEGIGVWGHSMAGNILLRAMLIEPAIRAGVIWAGAVYSYDDFTQYAIDDPSYNPAPQPNHPAAASASNCVKPTARPTQQSHSGRLCRSPGTSTCSRRRCSCTMQQTTTWLTSAIPMTWQAPWRRRTRYTSSTSTTAVGTTSIRLTSRRRCRGRSRSSWNTCRCSTRMSQTFRLEASVLRGPEECARVCTLLYSRRVPIVLLTRPLGQSDRII